MGPSEGGVSQLTAAPRATRGAAIAAALATFWVSAAIGFVAVRRWRRAAFWLLTDWVWMFLAVVGGMTGNPRLMWGGFAGFLAWRPAVGWSAAVWLRCGGDRAGIEREQLLRAADPAERVAAD